MPKAKKRKIESPLEPIYNKPSMKIKQVKRKIDLRNKLENAKKEKEIEKTELKKKLKDFQLIIIQWLKISVKNLKTFLNRSTILQFFLVPVLVWSEKFGPGS